MPASFLSTKLDDCSRALLCTGVARVLVVQVGMVAVGPLYLRPATVCY